jgi:nitrous oxide reductase accessory protein NosL
VERLTRERIEAALVALDGVLGARGIRAQLYLVGGAVMCLVHRARTSTKDVDAWFTEPAAVREAARVVADDMGLPDDWLNDAAKAYLPAQPGFEAWRSDDRTLFAMKCAAARTAEDAEDISFLARRLGLASAQDALGVVLAYYPPERLPVRTRLLLEEMLG